MTSITNEEQLNEFFQNNESAVITYFLDADCEGCEELLPVFEEIAQEPDYGQIKFGMMQAQPGSIAENLVSQKQLPFVGIYKQGELVKCGSVGSEKEFRKLLRKF